MRSTRRQALRVGVDEIVTTTTECPAFRSSTQAWLPMYPAPPGNENVHKYDLLIVSHYLIVTETPCSFKSRGFQGRDLFFAELKIGLVHVVERLFGERVVHDGHDVKRHERGVQQPADARYGERAG